MDPVSRPEWSSPLEVGRHVRSFYTSLPEAPSKSVLSALCEDHELVAFLERHPLGQLEFSGRVPNVLWVGSYDAERRDLTVNSNRSPDTYGTEFDPHNVTSVSAAGRNLLESMQRTLYHEVGHHIVDNLPAHVLDQIENVFRAKGAIPVTRRARRNPIEYFCETYAAYRFEDCLADKDPEGYHMIGVVLKLAWNK